MRVFRSFAAFACLWASACANPGSTGPTTSSAKDGLVLDINTSERVAGGLTKEGQTLRFDFEHQQDCYAATFLDKDGQELLRASSCSDGDVLEVGDRVTMRAPAGVLLGGAAPRWDQVQMIGKLDDARDLIAGSSLSLANELGRALSSRADVDTSVLSPALVRAAHAAGATAPSGAVAAENVATCAACSGQCLLKFTACLANPFIAPFCPIWLTQCQTNCVVTLQCP
jgi:hypothetical protein